MRGSSGNCPITGVCFHTQRVDTTFDAGPTVLAPVAAWRRVRSGVAELAAKKEPNAVSKLFESEKKDKH
jgi:hypothetical protein